MKQSKVDKLYSEFEAGYEALFDDDGERIYAQQEHVPRVEALLVTLEEAVEKTDKQGEELRAEAKRIREGINTDPLATLTTDEQAAASGRALFVREDAEDLKLEELAKRVRAVVLNGDSVDAYLWLRYAGRRATATKDGAASGQPLRREESTALGQMQDDLEALAERLTPEEVPAKIEKADKLKQEAFERERHARRTLARAKSKVTGQKAHYVPRL